MKSRYPYNPDCELCKGKKFIPDEYPPQKNTETDEWFQDPDSPCPDCLPDWKLQATDYNFIRYMRDGKQVWRNQAFKHDYHPNYHNCKLCLDTGYFNHEPRYCFCDVGESLKKDWDKRCRKCDDTGDIDRVFQDIPCQLSENFNEGHTIYCDCPAGEQSQQIDWDINADMENERKATDLSWWN